MKHFNNLIGIARQAHVFAVLALYLLSNPVFANVVKQPLPKTPSPGPTLPSLPDVHISAPRLPPPPIFRDPTATLWFEGRQHSEGGGTPNAVTPTPRSNSSTADTDKSPKSCNPVIIATGEKVLSEPDFFDASTGGLSMTRDYRSELSSKPGRLFGPRWHSSFDFPKMEVSPTCSAHDDDVFPDSCSADWVTIARPDGTTHTYEYAAWPMYFPMGLGGGDSSAGYLMPTSRVANYYQLVIGDKVYNYSTVSGNMTSIDERGARLFTFTYITHNGLSVLEKVTARNGKFIQFSWTNGRVTSATDSAGNVWIYEYTAGNLTKVIPPVNTSGINGANIGVRKYFYEDVVDAGLVTGIAVDDVRQTEYKYNSAGQVTDSGTVNGEKLDTFVYSSSPRFTEVTNQRGQVTKYNFEDVGGYKRLKDVVRNQTTSCSGSVQSQIYDSSGNVAESTDWNLNKTTSTFSYGGLLETEMTASNTGVSAIKRVTWSGIKASTVTLAGSDGQNYLKTEYQYASGPIEGLLASETTTDLMSGETRTVSYGYTFHTNNLVQTMSVSQALPTGSAVTTYNYNSLGFLTSVENPLGHKTFFAGHNNRGQPGTKTDPNNVVTTYTYDSLGNLTGETTAGYTTNYKYNGDRKLTQVTTNFGEKTTLEYNTAGRLSNVKNTLDESVTFTRDIANNLSSESSSRRIPALSNGVPSSIDGNQFVRTAQSDSLGRLWNTRGTNGQRLDYTYDNNGNLTKTVDSLNRITSFEYDAQNRLTKTIAADLGITTFQYDNAGQLWKVKDPRSLETIYTYNGFGEMLSQTSPTTGITSFTYDIGGRMQTETRPDQTTITYTWDNLNRMTSRSVSGEAEIFHYDSGTLGKVVCREFQIYQVQPLMNIGQTDNC